MKTVKTIDKWQKGEIIVSKSVSKYFDSPLSINSGLRGPSFAFVGTGGAKFLENLPDD